jgi:hypothetical protein
MRYVDIKPEDVSALDAKKVLDSLNSLNTPEEIDRAVELVGEPDVGIKLGRRILDWRENIGKFESLEQILDVPLIGPKRFTDIVVSLTGRSAEEIKSDSYTAVLRELKALRDKVSTLEAFNKNCRRVTLRIVKNAEFLGQPLVIEAKVIDHNLNPVTGAPVAFAATWGDLKMNDGFSTRQGACIKGTTGVTGTVAVTLMSPLPEPLKKTQQVALESMLSTLKPDALCPSETESALKNMAKQYRWDIKENFRQAVDIYFQTLKESPKQHINTHDYMTAWSFVESTVFAHVLEGFSSEESNTAVEASGALNIRLKNWLGPWMQTYIRLAASENTLKNEIPAAKQNDGDTGAMIKSISNSLVEFVGKERGIVGEQVGRQIAEASVKDFLSKELVDLPLDDAADLLSNLGAISRTVVKSGAQVVEVVNKTSSKLKKELDRGVIQAVDMSKAEVLSKIDGSNTKISVLERKVDNKVDAGELGDITVLKARIAEIDNIKQTLTNVAGRVTEIDDLKTKLTTVESKIVEIDGKIRIP